MPVKFEKVDHIYQKGTSMAFKALSNIDLEFEDKKFYGIIGHTGSGKSTLIQHINVLLKPTSGKVVVNGKEIIADEKAKKLKEVRRNVGFVFQFPEHQLFEETILKDIMFGPMNFGVDEEKARRTAFEMLDVVGLDKSYAEKSPFELSGGQMRRVAIAGVLAIGPDILILDEPTAGLDPKGQKEMMDLFKELNTRYNKTIILVTHDMNDVNDYCDEVIVMNNQELFDKGNVKTIFGNNEALNEIGLSNSFVQQVATELNKNLDLDINYCQSLDELVDEIRRLYHA
jgi:energy-coupling factor transport system ATP-binding protein